MPDGTFEGDINKMADMAFTSGATYKDEALIPSNNTDSTSKRGTFIPDGYG